MLNKVCSSIPTYNICSRRILDLDIDHFYTVMVVHINVKVAEPYLLLFNIYAMQYPAIQYIRNADLCLYTMIGILIHVGESISGFD